MVGVVEGAQRAPVVGVADVVGQVLDQRPAERDVDQLHPAADPQHRQVALQRAQRQGDLRVVAVGAGVGGLRVARRRRRRRGRCPRRRPAPGRRARPARRRGGRPPTRRAGASARSRRRPAARRRRRARAGTPRDPIPSSAPARARCRGRSVVSVNAIVSWNYPPSRGSHEQPMTVQVQRRGAVATIVLDRPEAMNAVNPELGDELLRSGHGGGRATTSVRAVVLTGNGRAFCSGADLRSGFEPHRERPSRTCEKALQERFHPIILALRQMPKPVVAAVNGAAAGIGCSFALACDLVVAAESSYFLLAFVNIGLVADGGSSLPDPGAGRVRPRGRDGDARRARPGAKGARVGADQPRGQRRRPWPRTPRRSPTASPRARRAPTRAPSASSTPGSSPASRRSWSSRRPSSRRWRNRATSSRA